MCSISALDFGLVIRAAFGSDFAFLDFAFSDLLFESDFARFLPRRDDFLCFLRPFRFLRFFNRFSDRFALRFAFRSLRFWRPVVTSFG